MFKKSATVEPIEVQAPERSKAWKEEGAPAGAPAAAPGSKVAQTAVVKYGAPDSPPEHNGEDLDDGSEDSDQIGFAKGRKEQLRRTDTMRFDPNDNLTWVQSMWMTLDEPSFSRAAFYYAQLSLTAILISTVTFCLETEFNCSPALIVQHKAILTDSNCESWVSTWWWFEACAVIFFTVELLLRFLSCPSKRLFVRGFANWVDLIAILPFYLEQAAGNVVSSISVFRVVRLVRVMRVFKMGKSFAGLNLMVSALRDSLKVLAILTFLILIATIVFSSAIFYLEANGDAAHWYRSIPRAFWWCFVTMTTVGYGDSYPMTDIGRALAVLAMISGILILAMPITVIGANFAAAYERQTFENDVINTCTREITQEEISQRMLDAKRTEEKAGTEVVDLDKLMAFLRDLELRGNLKIPRPKNMHALERLLAEYDAKGDGVTKMQKREWQAFLNDCVVDATEFTSLTVQKLARDVNDLREELRITKVALEAMQADMRLLMEMDGVSEGDAEIR
eukprot:Transcript_26743.p1 GENE.Transcript_26743~~Transcript_26743.p1  ORF type:complete len:507 (-),score=213.53 Transcript_26743:427-1947(-)